MKRTILCALLITGLILSTPSLDAQTSGGGGSAGSGGGGSAGASATTSGGSAPRTGIVSPIVTPKKPSPGVPGGPAIVTPVDQFSSQGTQSTTTTNNFAATTNGVINTNGLVGMTNNPSAVAGVNPISNGFATTNIDINGNLILTDRAVTRSDRILLTTLSQGVRSTLGITPNGNAPVHFMINNGTVTVVGTVQSSEQREGVVAQVQQTPGVLRVINDLHVASPLATAQSRLPANGTFTAQTDSAFSPRDQTLLTTIQQQSATQLGIQVSSQMPVHFSVQNGIVGVTGNVASLQEKQAVIAAIARTPGVVRVVDNVAVPGMVGLVPHTVPGAAVTSNLPPTSRPTGSNTMFFNSNNASGF